MNIGEKIFYLRTSKGFSQEEMADELKISRQTISKWELGMAVPDTDKIVAISRMFKVTTDFLLFDEYGIDNLSNLDRVVIQFLNCAKDMESISDELVEIAKDGVIDESEKVRLNEMMSLVDGVFSTVEELKRLMET
ncbi:MAG: helix-turn-helix domain-containing protein [Lachnospiraceae bacterium]|nr:helix-turn-helix domain-containing protein [Lachnospiraceae bacterium]